MRNLIKLYNINSPSGKEDEMRKYILKVVSKYSKNVIVDESGNICVTKGIADDYPCIACHIDEVHKPNSNKKIIVQNNIIYGYDHNVKDYTGIGADDKNGIWICINLLKTLPILKVVFFVGEEIGGIGSSKCDLTFFDNCRFVVQCDRKGNSDFINNIMFSPMCSEEFTTDCNLSKYSYKPNTGIMTDILILKERGLNISCCNVSVGYYNHHFNNEFTNFSELQHSLEFVKNICSLTKVYPHTTEIDYYNNLSNDYLLNDYYSMDDISEEEKICNYIVDAVIEDEHISYEKLLANYGRCDNELFNKCYNAIIKYMY
jgi:tripeptide aminopeptidase